MLVCNLSTYMLTEVEYVDFVSSLIQEILNKTEFLFDCKYLKL